MKTLCKKTVVLIGLLLYLLNLGCASVGSGGREQILLVDSEPKGAKVYYKGKWVGTTPDLVRVDSGFSPEIEVAAPGEGTRKRVALETSYRWKRSFFSNLIFISYAPVGWIIDLVTGGAWEIEEPRKFQFKEAPADLAEPDISIAIAPPDYRTLGVSRKLGMALQKKLEADGKYRVLAYDQGEKQFIYYGDGDPFPKDKEDRRELFHQLNNDTYLISKAEYLDGKFVVDATVKSVYTDETLENQRIALPSEGVLNESQQVLAREFGDYFSFFPNTAFINLGSRSQSIGIDNRDYDGELVAEDSAFGQMSQVVERISLSRLEPIQAFTFSRFQWSFIPDLNISRDRINYKLYPALEDVVFQRTVLSAGYGPRLAYMASWGMIYFDLFPQFAWTSIQSEGGVEDSDLSETNVVMSAEFGYLYYWDKNWVAKVFSRYLGENAEMWQDVVRDATGGTERVDTSASNYFGLSFGYRFDL